MIRLILERPPLFPRPPLERPPRQRVDAAMAPAHAIPAQVHRLAVRRP